MHFSICVASVLAPCNRQSTIQCVPSACGKKEMWQQHHSMDIAASQPNSSHIVPSQDLVGPHLITCNALLRKAAAADCRLRLLLPLLQHTNHTICGRGATSQYDHTIWEGAANQRPPPIYSFEMDYMIFFLRGVGGGGGGGRIRSVGFHVTRQPWRGLQPANLVIE